MMNCHLLDNIKQSIENDFDITLKGLIKLPASNCIYEFKNKKNDKVSHILKEVDRNSEEAKFYKYILPRLTQKSEFVILELPICHNIYDNNSKSYILLEYYINHDINGNEIKPNNFNTDDMDLAEQMPILVKDLKSVNLLKIFKDDSLFDYDKHEKKFWEKFKKLKQTDLINSSIIQDIEEKSKIILNDGRHKQDIILSNFDFNPRNIIRSQNNKLILIDWSHLTAPLEHHLVYPWLINFGNKNWQSQLVRSFEVILQIEPARLQYNLMWISLNRTILDYKLNSLQSANGHYQKFLWSLDNCESLIDCK